MLPRTPAEFVKTAREVLVMTQQQLATQLGVHQVTVARWETGDRVPADHHTKLITSLAELHYSVFAERCYLLHHPELGGGPEALEGEVVRWMVRRAILLSTLHLQGVDARLSSEQWLELLNVRPSVLYGVPQRSDPENYSNYVDVRDVAVALEAAARGISFRAGNRLFANVQLRQLPDGRPSPMQSVLFRRLGWLLGSIRDEIYVGVEMRIYPGRFPSPGTQHRKSRRRKNKGSRRLQVIDPAQ